MNAIDQKPFRIIGWQAVLALFVAVMLLPFFDAVTAYSALAGGMISALANAFFVVPLFSNKGGWQAGQLAVNAYRGIIGKLFLTTALFLLAVVILRPLNPAVFFATYLLVQVSPAFFAGVMNKA